MKAHYSKNADTQMAKLQINNRCFYSRKCEFGSDLYTRMLIFFY